VLGWALSDLNHQVARSDILVTHLGIRPARHRHQAPRRPQRTSRYRDRLSPGPGLRGDAPGGPGWGKRLRQ
jgi:hypothetical protein